MNRIQTKETGNRRGRGRRLRKAIRAFAPYVAPVDAEMLADRRR